MSATTSLVRTSIRRACLSKTRCPRDRARKTRRSTTSQPGRMSCVTPAAAIQDRQMSEVMNNHVHGVQKASVKLNVTEDAIVMADEDVSVLRDGCFRSWTRSPGCEDDVVLGFESDLAVNMLDIKLGKVSIERWMACARNKLWWMTPEWGSTIEEVPTETQFLLLKHKAHGPYTLLLPLIQGSFRSTLKADRDRSLKPVSENLVLRIESGAPAVTGMDFPSALLIASGHNLFELIERGVTTAAKLSGDARPRAEKHIPESLDYFGWCTWDAFYSGVSAKGVRDGLQSLKEGGVMPRTLIIDDGWQQTQVDDEFSDSRTTRALRQLRLPVTAATAASDEEFEASEQSVLSSYADALSGGSELMTTMPALADSDYGDGVRKALRSRDGEGDEQSEKIIESLDRFKRAAKLQVPQIERTVLQLTKQPKDTSLWTRLLQRVAGWAVGISEVVFLLFYQTIVDPAGPNSWPVSFFERLATGPLKPNMLMFFKVSGDFTRRVITVKANGKFSRPGAAADQREWFAEAEDFRSVTDDLRSTFELRYIYCWHSLSAYWGGVMPEAAEFQELQTSVVYPQPSAGLREIEPAMLWNPAVLAGIGLVQDSDALYQNMHRYLSSAGVDGVKVDCQAGIGLVGSCAGGGPALARSYHASLEDSIARHFPGNHAINCMCHSTENIYHMRDTAVARASDDFYPREAASSSPHIAACAYNSLFLAPLCQPDWDMFQSLHPAARLHSCARAVSGAAVYVSDKVGKHDFDVLRTLVLRDGSVLRAVRPGLPTADCVFLDPLRDGESLLKVWTRNRHSGMLGLFHLQGSFWDRQRRRFTTAARLPTALSCLLTAWDVAEMQIVLDSLPGVWAGSFAMLRNSTGALTLIKGDSGDAKVTLAPGDADLVTLAPCVEGPKGVTFAALGLENMLNSGGAVQSWSKRRSTFTVGLKGEGSFVAHCTVAPEKVLVDGLDVPRSTGAQGWTFDGGKLAVDVSVDSPSASIEHQVCVTFG